MFTWQQDFLNAQQQVQPTQQRSFIPYQDVTEEAESSQDEQEEDTSTHEEEVNHEEANESDSMPALMHSFSYDDELTSSSSEGET